jgi:hypothetical protein
METESSLRNVCFKRENKETEQIISSGSASEFYLESDVFEFQPAILTDVLRVFSQFLQSRTDDVP